MYKAIERRRNEADAVNARHGVKKETSFIQPTPQGDFILVYQEAEDFEKLFTGYMADQDPFVVWLKERFKELTRVDFSQSQQAPPQEQVWRYGY